MDVLLNGLKRHVGAMLDAVPQARWGVVASVDNTRPAVKVLFQPEGVQSGWLPVLQGGAGNSWTVLAPISPGSLAFCVPEAGARGGDYVVTGFAHNDGSTIPAASATNGTGGTQNTAAQAWTADEMLIVHKSGSVLRMCANGDIYLRPASGTLKIDGNLTANGDVSDRHGSLDRLRGNYDAHTHPGIVPGISNTGTTSAPDPE